MQSPPTEPIAMIAPGCPFPFRCIAARAFVSPGGLSLPASRGLPRVLPTPGVPGRPSSGPSRGR